MIKLFEMFAGYGGASFALKKAEIPFECVGYSEIDKYAIQCYEQNHQYKSTRWTGFPEDAIHNYGDATKIDPEKLPDFDLLTGGFPCQAFSVAGKGLGEQDTRGTLFHEIIRIAEAKKPKYMLLENVKGLTSKKHSETFSKILSELDRIGYDVCWNVVNSKDYGIPQNRERVFFVCIREDMWERKHWFPEKEELKIFLKDILEGEVDEKYYLSEKALDSLKNKEHTFHKRRLCKDISPTLLSRDYKDPKLIQLNNSKIRKLTPTECFRLMGFLNDEINLEGLSDTQKYKLAGNGWDINLVSKIFKEMFK